MKFVLKDKSRKTTLTFPITPNELSVTIDSKTITYDHIAIGDSTIPRGTKPISISFSGVLPSKLIDLPRDSSTSADRVVKQIRTWQKSDRKRLNFIATGTPWNLDVFISDFNVDYTGPQISYSITLTEYKSMTVRVTKAKKKPKPAQKRPATKSKSKVRWYTVKRGDCLWNIAKKYTGRGARWTEMWAINKSRSRSKNPHLIYPGERFKIPAKW